MRKKLVAIRVVFGQNDARIIGLASTRRGTTYMTDNIVVVGSGLSNSQRKENMAEGIEALLSSKE